MKSKVHIKILILGFLVFSVAGPLFARVTLEDAYSFFDAEDYEKSAEIFAQKIEEFPLRADLHYNQALALYKAGKYEEAEKSFLEAVTRAGEDLESKTYYNMGNTMFRRAQEEEFSDMNGALRFYGRALEYYMRASMLDPDDEDSAYNYEYTLKKIEEMEELADKMEKEEEEKGERENDRAEEDDDSVADEEDREEDKESPQPPETGETGPDDKALEALDKEVEDKDEVLTETRVPEELSQLEDRSYPDDVSEQEDFSFEEEDMSREKANFILLLQQEEEMLKRKAERKKAVGEISEEEIRNW